VGVGTRGGETMNWQEFFEMKGYALYVWGSYGIAFLVFSLEVILVRHKRKITLQQLRMLHDAKNLE
jgi:heme exporter protein D